MSKDTNENNTVAEATRPSWIGALWAFTEGYRAGMAASLALAVVGVAGGMLPFVAVWQMMNLAWSGTTEGYVPWIALALAGIAAQALGYVSSTILSHKAAYGILENLRNAAADSLAAASLGDVMAMPSGVAKKIIVDDIEDVELPLAHVIPEFGSNVLVVAACLVLACVVDVRMGASMLIAPVVSIVPFALLMRGFQKSYAAYWEANERVNATLVEYIDGIEVIKTFNCTDESYERYRNEIGAFERFTLEWYRASQGPMNAMYAILPTLLLGVVPVGVLLVSAGSIDISGFLLCCLLAIGMVGPLTKVTQYINLLKQIEKDVNSASELLSLPPLPESKSPAHVEDASVALENVCFAYADEEVLHNVSLAVPPGSKVALVGPSGSGKSTIAKLVARFWDVGSGSVKVGGADVRDMPFSQLAGMVSYVSQDNFLFDCSIAENIALGRPGATTEEVMRAARAACCANLADRFADGLNTPAGVAGGQLSGGERQRISLARAYLKDAPIVVLDEATAYIDPESELELQQALRAITESKTLIVIAHRLSTVRDFDQICVVDKGSICAQGTHDELLEESVLYQRLWEASTTESFMGGSSASKEACHV